jgi:hypothetical protein
MNRVTSDDVLFGYRLQLFDLALAPRSRRPAARWVCTVRPTTTGSATSTGTDSRFCAPASAGSSAMPNELLRMVEERVLAFSIAQHVHSPRRVADALALPR